MGSNDEVGLQEGIIRDNCWERMDDIQLMDDKGYKCRQRLVGDFIFC